MEPVKVRLPAKVLKTAILAHQTCPEEVGIRNFNIITAGTLLTTLENRIVNTVKSGGSGYAEQNQDLVVV